MQKYLIDIVGPTASGKTATAIALANHFQAEIISCDSRQFFKEMSIGTAVPDPEELAAAKHNFIQHISILEEYSVGHFERESLAFVQDYFKTQDILIMVGGSMLYEKALVEGLDKFPEVAPEFREELNQAFEEKGIVYLQELLKEKDPAYYHTVDLQNYKRIIRALEICLSTGKAYSSFLNQGLKNRNFKTIKIGMDWERQSLYDRINLRVDLMMEKGLLKEAMGLYKYKDLNALNTVGYKELFKFFEQEWTLDFAVSEIKKNSRRFAKRQLTWYRKDEKIQWYSPFSKKEILAFVEQEISRDEK